LLLIVILISPDAQITEAKLFLQPAACQG